MKKFYFLFTLLFCQFLIGQISDFNNLCVNNSNIQFSNKYFTQKFKTPGGQCSRDDNNNYKSVNYYKITTGGIFEFTINSSKAVSFHVWVLNESDVNNFFDSTESKFNSLRSSYQSGNTSNIGLFSTSSDECQYYNNANGRLKSITVAAGEYVVIGVISNEITTTFSITPGGTASVCQNEPTRENLTLDLNKCEQDVYTYSEVEALVKNKSSLNDIKLFSDENLQNQILNSALFGNNHPEIFATVKDQNGVVKYIYQIKFQFVPNPQFNFKSSLDTIYECSNVFTIPSEQEILARLFDQVLPNYSISSIIVNGSTKQVGDQINLIENQEIDLKVKVKFNGVCTVDSDEKIISIKQETFKLDQSYVKSTCEDNYLIDFDEIFTMISKDKSLYDLNVKYNGNQISNGTRLPLIDHLNLKITIKSKSGGYCESNEVDLLVNKTQNANIINTEIKDYCINDLSFTPTLVGAAVNQIQNGNHYLLKFYKVDGTEIEMSDIYAYIKEILVGKIIVKALNIDNPTICDTVVELKFNVNKSSFATVNRINPLISSCLEYNSSQTFTKSEIEAYLRQHLNGRIDEFSSIENVELNSAITTKEINFKIRLVGEQCWSEEMKLELKINYKPNFISKTDNQTYCEGEQIIFDSNYLKRIFGEEIVNYDLQINGRTLDWNSPLVERLNFGTGTSKVFTLVIKNNDSNCSQSTQLTINKKENFIPINNNYNNPFPIFFCSNDNTSLILAQIESVLEEIKNETRGYLPTLTAGQILEKYKVNRTIVEVEFKNPNYCNSMIYKFDFEEKQNPEIKLPAINEVCNGGTIAFDLKSIDDFYSYDFQLYNAQNQIMHSINGSYELYVGNYTLKVNHKGVSCTSEYKFEVKSAPNPIIEKIIINKNEINVIANGEGNLMYALFDEYGSVIVDWQNNNTLKIPAYKKLKNAFIQVKLNDCGISTRNDITILDIQDVFTPNGDHYNNQWSRGLGDEMNDYFIQIYNRYGQTVYENSGKGVLKWDGKKNGTNVASDTYYYLIKPLNSASDLQVQYTGSILVKHK